MGATTTALDRDHNGRFQNGNQLSKGHNHPNLKRLMELREMFLQCVTVRKVARIEEEMFKIATESNDERMRLAGCVEWWNRVFGKPVESLAIQSVPESPRPLLNISPEQAAILEAIIVQNPPKPSASD